MGALREPPPRSPGVSMPVIVFFMRAPSRPGYARAPHVQAVFLDGVYREEEDELEGLAHLTTREVATVLERTRDRIKNYVGRQGLLQEGDAPQDASGFSDEDGLAMLAASAVSCTTPPAGPEWRRGARRAGPRGASQVTPATRRCAGARHPRPGRCCVSVAA
jgi:hypothetical protein